MSEDKVVKMADLTEKIRDRVKDIFAELIPEEAWHTLVGREIVNFQKNTLPGLVEAELKNIYIEKIKEELNKPGYMATWEDGTSKAGDEVKKIIGALAPTFVAQLFAGVADQIVSKIRNDMQSGQWGF